MSYLPSHRNSNNERNERRQNAKNEISRTANAKKSPLEVEAAHRKFDKLAAAFLAAEKVEFIGENYYRVYIGARKSFYPVYKIGGVFCCECRDDERYGFCAHEKAAAMFDAELEKQGKQMNEIQEIIEMGNVVEVPLSQGKIAIIDAEDAERVLQFKWSYSVNRKTKTPKPYALRTVWGKEKQSFIKLHRFILNAPEGMQVDHINGNGLDNRRCNLRPVTVQQNRFNLINAAPNATGFRGVQERYGKYKAYISTDNKTIHLGTFATAEAAARAYDKKAKELRGEFAVLNFPDESDKPFTATLRFGNRKGLDFDESRRFFTRREACEWLATTACNKFQPEGEVTDVFGDVVFEISDEFFELWADV